MHFAVTHETLYRYSVPVRFAPHLLRLTPRPEGISAVSHAIAIRPAPCERIELTDAFGNRVTRLAFDDTPSVELRISSTFELETRSMSDAVLDDASLPLLPWPGTPGDERDAYLRPVDHDPNVGDFARGIAARAGHAPGALLKELTLALHERIDRQIRVEGAAQSPAQTLTSGRGACRDITVLFLAACRTLGIPGRFVSGYQARSQTPDGERHLHAWAEVFVPSVGWSAWDPTHGVRVSDGHVALCAAPEQSATMPVEGGFFPPLEVESVTSTLDTSVRIATR